MLVCVGILALYLELILGIGVGIVGKEGKQASLAADFSVSDTVKPPHQVTSVARTQLIQTFSEACAARNPPWSGHFGPAMRVLCHLLLSFYYRFVPRLADGRLCYSLHHGSCVFARFRP